MLSYVGFASTRPLGIDCSAGILVFQIITQFIYSLIYLFTVTYDSNFTTTYILLTNFPVPTTPNNSTAIPITMLDIMDVIMTALYKIDVLITALNSTGMSITSGGNTEVGSAMTVTLLVP